MNHKKPKPPLFTIPCQFPGCDIALRAIYNRRTSAVRAYHGEDGLIEMEITDLKPGQPLEEDAIEQVIRLFGYQIGIAVGEFHAERGDR